MTPPRLWRPSEEDVRHVVSRERELQPGTTALDALEDLLSRFDKRAVGGVKRWFKELGGLRGYWFDKRMQTLEYEMLSVSVPMDWAEVTRVERDPAHKTPDLVARAQGLIVVADAKALLGKYWPVKIVQTMLRSLEENFGLETVGRIIVVLSNMDVKPELLEREVDQLTVDSLMDSVEVVATAGGSLPLTRNLVVERATRPSVRHTIFKSRLRSDASMSRSWPESTSYYMRTCLQSSNRFATGFSQRYGLRTPAAP
jgi:hypothetical protein